MTRNPRDKDVLESLVLTDPRVQSLSDAYQQRFQEVFAEVDGFFAKAPGELFRHRTEKDADGRTVICRVFELRWREGTALVQWDVHAPLMRDDTKYVPLTDLFRHHFGGWVAAVAPAQLPETGEQQEI